MEKNRIYLSNLRYQDLVNRIVSKARQAACAIPELRDSKNGCVRVTMKPLSSLAELWLGGGLSDFYSSPNDICPREFPNKLNPEGSYTMQYVCEDGRVDPVDCYGYSALKVAYASWKREFDAWVKDNNISEAESARIYQIRSRQLTPDNGYTLDRGVVYATVKINGADFMEIYISVSGAQDGVVDESCAIAGMQGMRNFFTSEPGDSLLMDEAILELSPESTSMYPPKAED